jgi:glycosyltransferase involved in cell wall biosynthesis
MRQLLRMADFVVYQSTFCRESADHFLGKARCPSATLFNPVDLAAFSPAPEPPGLDCCQLLAAGTHNQGFRVIGAVETVRHLHKLRQPAHLTIAGELRWPRAKLDVKEAIARCGVMDAVELRPPFTQAEAVEMLRASHILLHAKYHDPCPTMVIEALACGVPVIGSRSGGMPELLGFADEGGELIDVPLSWEHAEYPHPTAMAAAVERIMVAWPERSRLARARAERLFGVEAWLREHERIFGQVLAAP